MLVTWLGGDWPDAGMLPVPQGWAAGVPRRLQGALAGPLASQGGAWDASGPGSYVRGEAATLAVP